MNYSGKNVTSVQVLEVSLLGAGTVLLRLARNARSMFSQITKVYDK